jgi:predicted NAD/FAD-binding protein
MLSDPSPSERELLGAIEFQRSELVLHSDSRLMPRRRAAWSSWNAHLLDRPVGAPAVTYWLNNLQGHDSERELLATLNLTERVDPATILATVEVDHPVYTHAALRAQRRHSEISGVDRVHYAGAYWGWGFHEDGVLSAHRVAEAVAAPAPRSVMA